MTDRSAERRVAWLQRLIGVLPGFPDARIAAFLDAVRQQVAAGLPNEVVEPSFELGCTRFRLLVNPAAEPGSAVVRAERVLRLLASLDVASPGLADVVTGWLGAPRNEAFVGVAADEKLLRAKLYLKAPVDGRQIGTCLGALGLAAPSETSARMLCVDYCGGVAIAFKLYRTPQPAELVRRLAGAPIAEVLDALGVDAGGRRALISQRHACGGQALDASVHVQVEDLGSDAPEVAFARAAGFPGEAERLRALREIGLRARVLCQGANDVVRHVVYLGLSTQGGQGDPTARRSGGAT